MAKNYTTIELLNVVRANEDPVAIMDICRRYPQLAILANSVNEAGMAIIAAIPDYVTARKVNKALSGGVDEEAVDTAGDDEETIEEKPAKKVKDEKPMKKAKKPVIEEDEDDEEEEEIEEKPIKKRGRKPAKKVEVEEEDDEDEDEEPVKKPRGRKPAKKAVVEEEDDDDFDFD